MLSGMVFDIKEFAIHDGPGIRVTIFLKGCSLRCSWCHNPEGLLPEPQIIHRSDGQRLVGTTYTSKELADIINDKAQILRDNEGGVTFSGGEPLFWAKFIAEVIDCLDDMHVLLDTSGYGSEDDFRLLADRSDLIFFDLKLINHDKHREFIGHDNSFILQNLKILGTLDIPFVVRVPLIPEVTDTDENLSEIAMAINDLPNLKHVELLPYNKLAGAKYKSAKMEFTPGFDENRKLNVNIDIFQNEGIEVIVL